MLRRDSQVFFGVAVLLDTLFACAAWVLSYWIRFHWGPALVVWPRWLFAMGEGGASPFGEFVVLLPVVVLCALVALDVVGLYRPIRARSRMRELMRVCKASVLAWIAMLAVFYFLRQSRYSVRMVTLFLFVNVLALAASRFLLMHVLRCLRAWDVGLRRAAIVGVGELGQETLLRLHDNPWVGVKVAYFVDAEKDGGQQRIHGVPVRYCGGDLLGCLQREPVDAVFVAISMRQSEKMDSILRILSKLPVTVAVMPDFCGRMRISASAGEFEGMPMIQLCDTPVHGWSAVAKRMIDIVGSLLFLGIFGWWIMLVLAALIKLTSRGPVFFRQERMGLGGRPFMLWKFRSMCVAAEETTGPVWTERGDPRCTPIGRFMRKTSLDELPQLFNVLLGNMSLVGPRPERLHFVRQFTEELPSYMLRHSVKAGITGWAQVNGLRGKTSLRKRLQYDLYYINRWSLQFDVFILLITPFSGFINKNAY